MKEELKKIKNRLKELEPMLSDPAIFGDAKKLREINKEYSRLKETSDLADKIKNLEKEIKELLSAADPELKQMADEELPALEAEKQRLEAELEERLLPSDPLDEKSAIVEIRAGAGGDESALFSAELFRAYSKFADKMKWKTKILSSSRIGIGGFKEVIAEVAGDNAYGWMRYESGVHRVQRVPETEKTGRVHTSTVTVAVMPELDEVDFKINPQDIRIEATTSSGHGGQSVNTTYSAIRIVHIPTNTTVICQDERSQQQNKERAMEVLRARLFALEEERRRKEESAMRKSQIGTGDRSEKIRTYNFPQDRITDHRIKTSWHNINEIMEGDLEPMISKIKSVASGKSEAGSDDEE
jgi:peptide chain release factor 1